MADDRVRYARAPQARPPDPWYREAPRPCEPWVFDHDQADQERRLGARLLARSALLLLRETLSERDFALFTAVIIRGSSLDVAGRHHNLSRERTRAIVRGAQRRLRRLYSTAAAFETE